MDNDSGDDETEANADRLTINKESADDEGTANAITLIMFGLILAAYACCVLCGIKLTNDIVSAVIGFTLFVMPLAAISIVWASKTSLVNKFLTTLAFVSISLIIIVVGLTHTIGDNRAPILSQRIDSQNDVVAYHYYPFAILSGGDFDVGRALTTQVVQEQHLFPGIVRQYVLLEESQRDSVVITSLGDHRIRCVFPPYYYTAHDSPNDSFPLTRFVLLQH